jgi:hypothetical protein
MFITPTRAISSIDAHVAADTATLLSSVIAISAVAQVSTYDPQATLHARSRCGSRR